MTTDARSTTALDLLAGKRLRQRRQEHGLSQQALAEKLNITFQQIQKYEKGSNRMSGPRLFKISRLFKCTMDSFYAPPGRLLAKKRAKRGEARAHDL